MPELFHYNQSGSDEQVKAMFVARLDVLEKLKQQLLVTPEDNLAHHTVLIGSRGMGKTSLLKRLAIEIDDEKQPLATRFVALRFREEQYNVLKLDDFWKNCLESLAEWADERAGNAELAEKIDRLLEQEAIKQEGVAEAHFHEQMDSLGKRAVLLLDNLDLILAALSEQENWKLRNALQANAGPVVIGASTQTLEAAADREAAFYEFFHPTYLEALSFEETRACMLKLAQQRGEAGKRVQQVVNRQQERLRTLHTLTGGNPRVISLIYRLLESAETDEVMRDLEALLDDLTPYYKHKVEDYSTAQQRAVIDAIALNWNPITTGQLANATAIKSTTLSPLLKRLRQDGLIETVEGSGSYDVHQLAERFFNIWYLMRHGTRRTKQKMRWLTGFLISFYSQDELREIEKSFAAKQAGAVNEDYLVALRAAANGIIAGAAPDEWQLGEQKLPDELAPLLEAMERKDVQGVVAQADLLLDDVDAWAKRLRKMWLAWFLMRTGTALDQNEDFEKALSVFEKVIACFDGDDAPKAREIVAMAMLSKALAHNDLGDDIAAIATCDNLIACYGDDQAVEVRELVAMAMFNKGVMLGARGDDVAAIVTYDDLIARYGDDDAVGVREQVATALFNKGDALDARGDNLAAIATYDDLIARYRDDDAVGARERVARAMINKGATFHVSGDNVSAIATCDDLIARYGDDDAIGVRERVAKAMFNKGVALGASGDDVAEITAYDNLIACYGDDQAVEVRELVAMAMFNKGAAFRTSGDNVSAIATYDDLIARYGDDDAVGVRKVIVNAKIVLANLLIARGKLLDRAATLLIKAGEDEPLRAHGNLVWLHLLRRDIDKANVYARSLDEFPMLGRALISAAFDLYEDNFGAATAQLQTMLDGVLTDGDLNFEDDLERFVIIAKRTGYGDRLLTWFEESSTADKLAPFYAAFKAFMGGEKLLLDFNPEVRGVAEQIYERLVRSEANYA